MAGGQADVGLGLLGPPGQHPGPVGGGVLEPVGDQAAQGVLADLAAARIPTRAAGAYRGVRGCLSSGGSGAAVVGEGVVQGQDRDAAGGIAKGGVPQQARWGGSWGALRSWGALALQEAGGAAAAAAGGLGQGAGRPGLPVGPLLGIGCLQPRPDHAGGRSGWARRAAPAAAEPVAARRGVQARRWWSVRRTVVPWGGWPGRSSVGARSGSVALGGQAGDLAGVALEAFQHGQHGQGDGGGDGLGDQIGWAWATLPPIDASVPQPTSSQPYPAPLAPRRERLMIRNMP